MKTEAGKQKPYKLRTLLSKISFDFDIMFVIQKQYCFQLWTAKMPIGKPDLSPTEYVWYHSKWVL